jgi:hypothetical protein
MRSKSLFRILLCFAESQSNYICTAHVTPEFRTGHYFYEPYWSLPIWIITCKEAELLTNKSENSIALIRWSGYMNRMAAATRSRGRKRHVQQELFRRGGKRKGAGRKPKGTRAGSPHQARPAIKSSHALHVVLRVRPEIGSLRRRDMYKAMRQATIVAAVRERIRIVHVSLQRTHVHLLVEAENKQLLARGMQGFQISAARSVNPLLGDDRYRRRRGAVFVDRYHLEVITSPRRARHALSYVLNNWRKHREDQQGIASTWLVDPFSSGISFPDWKELENSDVMWPIRETYDPLIVRRPQSWILREGWKLAGSVSAHDVPSRRPR